MAAISERSPYIFLWDARVHKLSRIDTAMAEPLTLLVWSKNAHLLAIGTSKGNALIYNHQTSRKIPLPGRHSKKINSGQDYSFLSPIGSLMIRVVIRLLERSKLSCLGRR